MVNINTDLFKRTAPQKKLEIIKSYSESELLSIKYETVLRMIKEAGLGDSRKTRSKFKTLHLGKVGNDWNSTVDKLYNWKKDEVYLEVYIQGDDTDTTKEYKLRDFLDNRYEEQILAKIHESWDYGYSHTLSAIYNRSDRAEVIREICRSYVCLKYADKLKSNSTTK